MVKRLRRIALLSFHTSPLAQPGGGNAGGMNVYLLETARRLARRGVDVEIFTRATSPSDEGTVEVIPGVLIRNISAGPFGSLDDAVLIEQLCVFTRRVIDAVSARGRRYFDLVHSHYWMSGEVGEVVADRWEVPWVHTSHTLGAVKLQDMTGVGLTELTERLVVEQEITNRADLLIANTSDEAKKLVELLHAIPSHIRVVAPGADLEMFSPGGPGATEAARIKLGVAPSDQVVVFAGRLQPLKAPDVLIDAVARLVHREPSRSLTTFIVGGSSQVNETFGQELQDRAQRLGVSDRIRFLPPQPAFVLVELFRAADVVAVPSRSESFGLVALEAQASGSPVLAAEVGGLSTVVRGDITGRLIPTHDPEVWADELAAILDNEALRVGMAISAPRHAADFSWNRTVDELLTCYEEVGESFDPGKKHKMPSILDERHCCAERS